MTRIEAIADRGQRALPRSPAVIATHLFASALAILVALLGFIAETYGWLDNIALFLLLSATVLAYSVVQSWLVYRNEGQYFYLNPTIHIALLGNFLLLVVGGSTLAMPSKFGGFSGDITSWMELWMLYYVCGSVALWMGYWSWFSVVLVRKISRMPLLRSVIRRELRVRRVVLWVLLILGAVSQYALIKLGVFGFSQNPAATAKYANIIQYLTIGRGVLTFVLVVLAIQFFSGRSSGRKPIIMLILVFMFTVFSGYLSGFKSQVVMPVIIVGIAYYAVNQRVPKWVLPVGLLLLFSAYAVITPFRAARLDDRNFQSQSFFYIYETMFLPDKVPSLGGGAPSLAKKISHFLTAQFPIPLWSEGLRYVSEKEGLPEGSPEFLRNILIAPLLAAVPRIIWPDKPTSRNGNWFYVEVLDGYGETSVSISGVTSLYFAGGLVAVLAGFYFFGILQRALFRGLLTYGDGGMLILLGIFSALRGFDVYYVSLVDLFRTIPMMIVLQYFLLRPVKISSGMCKHEKSRLSGS